jgi:hypothetical protein
VTRSKELRRIEAAIEHKNEAELRWAESDCRTRLAYAKQFGSAGRGKMDRVRRLLKRIEAALLEVQKRN